MEEEPFELRVGMFFYVLGGIALMLFAISDLADQVDFDFFFVSLILFIIGYYFRRGIAPPPKVERFTGFKNMIKKMREGRKPKDKKG
ncbi:MAG: hypothetical protein KDD74_15105 [Anaerolineales bacterium]|nr:hypothetical protein [Anaerolineales bacterium]